ncbi:MAG: hypothetical protein P8L44_19145 [Opitutales bacterium]|nr:hypothetical protein [Opitutales bacterium]
MKLWKSYLLSYFCLSYCLLAHENEPFESSVTSGPTPWTNLEFQNDPDNFQFATVTDRTGSPRAGIFEDAVKKLNWLMPEFVMSVGDHDIRAKHKDNAATSEEMTSQWNKRLGLTYY